MVDLDQERPVLHRHRVHREHVEAGDLNPENPVLDVEAPVDVHIGLAEVDIPVVVVERVPVSNQVNFDGL